jgi:hypothetical protein
MNSSARHDARLSGGKWKRPRSMMIIRGRIGCPASIVDNPQIWIAVAHILPLGQISTKIPVSSTARLHCLPQPWIWYIFFPTRSNREES